MGIEITTFKDVEIATYKNVALRVTGVEYRQTRSFGNYQNETIGVVAHVHGLPGGDPETDAEQALEAVEKLVKFELDKREAARHERRVALCERGHAERRVEELRREIDELTAKLASARETWEKAASFLRSHGVAIPDEGDGIPF